MKEFAEELFNRGPILIVVFGIILLIIGASGGLVIGAFVLQVPEGIWKTIIGVVGLALIFLGVFLILNDVTPATTGGKVNIQGRYQTNNNPDDEVIISRIKGNLYRVVNPEQWDGVGFFDGKEYLGIFKYKNAHHRTTIGVWGVHQGKYIEGGAFDVHGIMDVSLETPRGFDVFWSKKKK